MSIHSPKTFWARAGARQAGRKCPGDLSMDVFFHSTEVLCLQAVGFILTISIGCRIVYKEYNEHWRRYLKKRGSKESDKDRAE